ncbi:MAG: hypothetical protein MJ053_03570 [Elusimicrobiaceae bacterium]|nr:hypothetical protein [Elusimicrobiaceae bacterium]
MWKRYFILLISCVLLTSGAWAQKSGFRQLAKTFTTYPARTKVSGTLAQRVERSYQTATLSHLRNQGQSPFYFPPTYHMQPLLNVDPATLYPDVPFLATSAQLSNYFLSRNNSMISNAISAQQHLISELNAHSQDIRRASRSVLEGEEINFLVHQIPENTSYLLVGEHHDVFSIYIHISLLITKLSKKFRNRPIILLTEFLPENVLFQPSIVYTPVLDIAHKLGIPVVGLEPAFVDENACLLFSTKQFDNMPRDIWVSPEGVRLRNEHWATYITNLRQRLEEHWSPNAQSPLFIIYTGAGHNDYSELHSLSSLLPQEDTFSVAFFPTYFTVDDGTIIYETSRFDLLTGGKFAKETVLHFKDRSLAKLAGHDIRIKVSPEVERTE